MHPDLVPNRMDNKIVHMDVSKNSGFSPQIIHELIGFSIINHPFWGVFPLCLETPIYLKELICVKSSYEIFQVVWNSRHYLGGGFNPSEKNPSNWMDFPK